MKKTFIASILSLTLFLAMGAALAYAQAPGSGGTPGAGSGGNPPPSGVKYEIKNPFRVGDSLYELLETIVKEIILRVGAVLCVLAFIYAGFMYVTAQGDTKKIETAHQALLYAAVGTAVLLGSWAIAGAIRNTINQLMA